MDWEGGVVEAPFMWKHDGRYYLFYSGNGYGGDKYAVGFATSTSLFGAPACSIFALLCTFQASQRNAWKHGLCIISGLAAIIITGSRQSCLIFRGYFQAICRNKYSTSEAFWGWESYNLLSVSP